MNCKKIDQSVFDLCYPDDEVFVYPAIVNSKSMKPDRYQNSLCGKLIITDPLFKAPLSKTFEKGSISFRCKKG